MDLDLDLETIIQSILAVDYVGFHEILEESPEQLPLSAAPPQSAESVSSASQLPTDATDQQSAAALCQPSLHGDAALLTEDQQNVQVVDHGQEMCLNKDVDSSEQPMDQEDELTLITQRMLRGEIPDIDSEVIRNILEESPNPLPPPPPPPPPPLIPQSGFHQPQTAGAAEEQAVPTLCQQPLHGQTIVLSEGRQNDLQGHGKQEQALVTADQMVHRLGPGVGGLVQSVDPNDELVLTIQRILRGEIPDVDSEEIWKILEESPNSSAPAVPAETRSNSQPQAVDPVGSGRRPLEAALHSLQQPAAAEQAAPALCRQLPHSHTVVLSGGQQNDQAGDHSQGQDLAPSRPSVSRPGKGSEASASASGAPQEHPEDELVLITQKMFREDMPHIDFDVLRQLLEESPNPLLPPPAPVFVGQPRSAQSVSSSSASLTADTLFAAEPATPAVYPVPLHNPTLAMAEGHYNELMSDDSQSQDHVDSSVGTETDSSSETSEQEDELTLITQRMLRGEILDIDSEEIRNILGESPDPLTAASGFKVPALGVGCTPMTAAPHGFQQPMTVAGGRMPPPLCHQPPHSQTVVLSGGHQNGHGATHSHRQYLSNQCPVYNSLGGAGGSLSPAYLQNQSQRLVFTPLAAAGNDASTSFMSLKLPQGVLNMPAVGVVNGEVVYEVPPDVTLSYVNLGPAAQNSALPNKKRRECKGLDEQPYVKKPPNAFMLFMREHRAKVAAEHSAAANAVLGLMWKSLSKDEQKKYRDEADQERIKHILQFPQWSCKDNYGKKRRRIRKKSPNITLATLSDPDVTQTVVLETSASQDYSDCE